jgi:hypothetical protein
MWYDIGDDKRKAVEPWIIILCNTAITLCNYKCLVIIILNIYQFRKKETIIYIYISFINHKIKHCHQRRDRGRADERPGRDVVMNRRWPKEMNGVESSIITNWQPAQYCGILFKKLKL